MSVLLSPYTGERGNMQSAGDVCDLVGDSVRDYRRIRGTADTRDFKVCLLIGSKIARAPIKSIQK